MGYQDRIEFEKKTSTLKGNIGEDIVKKKLEDNGYMVYVCSTLGSHQFDFLATKGDKFIICEVKTKARLNKYATTGINEKAYNNYMRLSKEKNMEVILYFVDEHPLEESVYCQKLSVLSELKVVDDIIYPNTKIASGIILFPLSSMKRIHKLTPEELIEIKSYSNRSYDYE